MCGFAGLIRTDGLGVSAELLRAVGERIEHRGPDDYGIYVHGNVGLSFRRLSILDLSQNGHQPMATADEQHVIVFNGEIYNYIELREELRQLGHSFRSSGDTEVLLAGYRQWGRALLPRLNGMFALLIHDRERRCVFGARDRFGVKPLFRMACGPQIAYASEIKAFGALSQLVVDQDRLIDLAAAGRSDLLPWSSRTFFERVEEVAPGSAFEIEADGTTKSWQWWNLDDARTPPLSADEAPASFAALFEDAVALRMRSDVPVGVMLSGGLDSTSIACAMARIAGAPDTRSSPLHAFLFEDPQHDETRYTADTLARMHATPHRIDSRTREAHMYADLQHLMFAHDEPVHSAAALAGYWLYQAAAQQGVRVVLGGQAADELFAGYTTYARTYWNELLWNRQFSLLRSELDAARRAGRADAELSQVVRRVATSTMRRSSLFRELVAARTTPSSAGWVLPSAEITRRQREILSEPTRMTLDESLRDGLEQYPLRLYLRVEDRNSMAHSVEARGPFMDYRVVARAFSTPSRQKITGYQTKMLVRRAMEGRIPESVQNRRDKMGFPVVASAWFTGVLRDAIMDRLHSRAVHDGGIFNVPRLTRLMTAGTALSTADGDDLFQFLQLSLFLEQSASRQSASAYPTPAATAEPAVIAKPVRRSA